MTNREEIIITLYETILKLLLDYFEKENKNDDIADCIKETLRSGNSLKEGR